MNSGIYCLTFSSGRFYIGKSIDIPTRWRQHEDKFSKGKAAQRMQMEYNQCGSPEKTVLLHCHADHIDIVETWMIDQYHQQSGNLMLNATYAEPIPDVDRLKVNRGIGLLSLSTPDHIELICDLQAAAAEVDEEIEQKMQELLAETQAARAKVSEYRECGILVPQEILDQREELEVLQVVNAQQEAENIELRWQLKELENKFSAYQQRSWWKRLWS